MKEEVKIILDKLDNTKEIKKLKDLSNKLNNNEKYLSLINEFNNNKEKYIQNNKELISLREKLFSIEELNEYLKIQNELRLLFNKVNNVILSIVD